ncbi:uncharacterized protein LOC115774589 [Archocentrus centrarchus]|uniref:uncharacterized protein LOC115774589 n=1 Tax=Archocentrus centrarchus TaxID=63155 RepID=UPI0011EA40B1|nr:uncharacterized protein LOC115774589 [Archocentrus centrarchus]
MAAWVGNRRKCGDQHQPKKSKVNLSVSRSGKKLPKVRVSKLFLKLTKQHKVSSPDKDLILEIPALPVRTGSDVTLRCKTGNGSVQKSYFFRDGVRLRSEPEEELILFNAQKSDEGLYSCSTAIDQSPRSRLRTRDSPLTTTTCSPPPSTFGNTGPPSSSPHPSLPTNSSSSPPRVSALRLFCHLLVFCPYCISTILLLMICRSRNPGCSSLSLKELSSSATVW